jgi:EAL domain-containing protein (putative c-di-GMP-specific phosphodiesterase class I)
MTTSGIRPSTLTIEVTEGLAMKNVEHYTTMLEVLRCRGVNFSMDDFGTGYISLSYLKQFPLTTLKIDRSFIEDLHVDEDGREITKAVIAMGQSLNLARLAEGVENEEQLETQRGYGCDCIQGYYYSKPMPVAEMTEYLHNQG